MANYEELLEIVLESVKDDYTTLFKYCKELKLYTKDLKRAIRDKDSNACISDISDIENIISNLEKFYDTLDPKDYPGEKTEKLIKSGITVVVALKGILLLEMLANDLYLHKDEYDDRIDKIDKGLTILSLPTSITTLGDMKKQIKFIINHTNKTLDKLKKKCTEKGFLKTENIKESVDDLKLEIYESCYHGEISEEERDELLSLMD